MKQTSYSFEISETLGQRVTAFITAVAILYGQISPSWAMMEGESAEASSSNRKSVQGSSSRSQESKKQRSSYNGRAVQSPLLHTTREEIIKGYADKLYKLNQKEAQNFLDGIPEVYREEVLDYLAQRQASDQGSSSSTALAKEALPPLLREEEYQARFSNISVDSSVLQAPLQKTPKSSGLSTHNTSQNPSSSSSYPQTRESSSSTAPSVSSFNSSTINIHISQEEALLKASNKIFRRHLT
ncbi:MAG: hypothetical protein IBJ00_04400 [Alphaproteobacteria bacterium]|nr:hypothetical protein [Alphaproteobacteria bacterium]